MTDLTPDDTASLIYFGILGFALAITFVALWRGNMVRLIYQAAVWVAAFGLLVVGYNAIQQMGVDRFAPRQSVIATGDGTAIEVPQSFDGHYHVTLGVNGVPVSFVIDTGATNLVLSVEDAERVGLDVDSLRFYGRAFTANGEVRTADARLDTVQLGTLTDRGVRAVVNAGEMNGSLLGMSYLSTFGRIEIEDRVLRLIR